MLFSVLKNLSLIRKLVVIDASNKTHTFGESEPCVKIKFTNESIQRKLYKNPSLYLGEGYMNGDIVIQEGTIEDFISIITASYDDFILNNTTFRFYENLSNILKPLQQINLIY